MYKKLSSILLGMLFAVTAFAGNVISNEGAWCWFADPRAVHYENASGTINASYIGYIDVHGNIKATQVDFISGKRTEVLVRSCFQPDDHNNPTFIVLPDERVMIFYTRHTDEPRIWYRISVKPGDISQLGAEKYIKVANNTTYPSPFILSDDPEHIYICWRGINWHPTMARITMPDSNDDVTVDFGPKQIVQSVGARPYAKYLSNGKDKIYVTYTTGHPDNEMPNWLYFNIIDINKGNGPILRDVKGTQLSAAANWPFKVYKTNDYLNNYPYTVVDHTANCRNWVWQTALDSDGNPVIAYVHIDNAKTTHVYHYGRWTGSQWRDTWVQFAGHAFHQNWNNTERCYTGGMALDPDSINNLYLSIPTANGQYNKDGVYEIWKYVISDDGKVTSSSQLTSGSAKNNVRPYILPGSKNSPLRLCWMNGDYYYWMVNRNYPKGYPTRMLCDYDLPEYSVSLADGRIDAASGNTAFTVSADADFTTTDNGTLFKADGLEVGINSSYYPYITLSSEGGDTTYTSTNIFRTSDDWATLSGGTNGDSHPTKINHAVITLTYDDNTLCLYRNETLEMKITKPNLTLNNVSSGSVQSVISLWNRALNQGEASALHTAMIAGMLNIPDTVSTDLVFPSSVQGLPVSWKSSNTAVIADDGLVTLPQEPVEVTLTAVISTDTARWNVVVMPRDINRNLQLYYTFEPADVDGQQVADHSGHGRSLTLMGSAKANGTLDLTANQPIAFSTNGYGLVPQGILGSLRSYTFMFDATLDSIAKLPRFYDFGSGSGNSVFLRLTSTGNYSAGSKLNGGTTLMVESSQSMATGQLRHIAVTFRAKDHLLSIYVDGQLVASGTKVTYEPWQLVQSAQDARNYIGRAQWWDNNSDNGDVVGQIDNFRLYDIALEASEIENTATAISAVTGQQSESDKAYNIAGQRVPGNYHGIVVMKGRKIRK